MSEIDDLVAKRIDELLEEHVKVRIEEETAWVTFDAERQVEVPLTQLVANDGFLLVRVPGPIVADWPASRVTVQALYPQPTPETIALAISSIPVDVITQRMAAESAIGSLDDTLGLIAMRALCGLLRGVDVPEPPADETLG
jgi:hypothetical protein